MRTFLFFVSLLVLSSCNTSEHRNVNGIIVTKNTCQACKRWINHEPSSDVTPATSKRVFVKFRDGREAECYAVHLCWSSIPYARENEIVAWKNM